MNNYTAVNYGWICPKCGSIYGPQVQECYRCNKAEFTSTCTTYYHGEENNSYEQR